MARKSSSLHFILIDSVMYIRNLLKKVLPLAELKIKNLVNVLISNTSCLTKRPRQTVQTQIRLLLKKQSVHGLPCLLFYRHFVNFSPDNQQEEEKSVRNFRTFTVVKIVTICCSELTGHLRSLHWVCKGIM